MVALMVVIKYYRKWMVSVVVAACGWWWFMAVITSECNWMAPIVSVVIAAALLQVLVLMVLVYRESGCETYPGNIKMLF